MGKFKVFLLEEAETAEEELSEINAILSGLDEEEVDELGWVLCDEFFDDEDKDPEAFYTLEDVQEMIAALGSDMYEYVLNLLSDEDNDGDEDDMDESVSRIMKNSNKNRKKRKFMGKSKAELRRTAAVRKRKNRATKVKRKRNYRANKTKIKAYQKSRYAAIKKGTHKVKLRRTAG